MVDCCDFAASLLRRGTALTLALAISCSALAQVPPEGRVTPGAAQPVLPAAPTTLQAPANAGLTLPAVVDRPVGIDEGPKVHVATFTLVGAKNHPEGHITVAALQQILDAAIAAQPADGYTVNQLQQIAAKVGVTYREHGFVLTQAFVPAQTVKDGEVTVQVLEGRLGAVRVAVSATSASRNIVKLGNSVADRAATDLFIWIDACFWAAGLDRADKIILNILHSAL